MTLRARFVDSISASPTVRLDLTTDPWRVLRTSRFDPPSIKRARVSTLLVDGSQYPASAYDDRVLELHLQLRESSRDAAAAAVQDLARELDRPGTNFFEYRLTDQTHSVFFRTFRLAMERVEYITDGTFQNIIAPVIAEPFGYGLREDSVVDAVVSADPAAGSNGCFVDVTGVKGDVESPALIKWPGGAVAFDRQMMTAARRRGTPSAAPFAFQVEAMTQGTDTSVQTNDTAFSGAGSNYSRCTFSTDATLADRVSFTDLGTASVDLRGIYRVFLRYRKNTAGDGINVRLRWGANSATSLNNGTLALPDVSTICLADLGLVSIPQGRDPVHDFRSGVELAVDDAAFFAVQAERTSGSGTLDLDFLVFVPADDRLSFVKWSGTQLAADHWWLDAHDNSVHARTSADEVAPRVAPSVTGGFPLLAPDQANRVYLFYETGPGLTHAIATNTTVSVSYFPRYLTIRPAST